MVGRRDSTEIGLTDHRNPDSLRLGGFIERWCAVGTVIAHDACTVYYEEVYAVVYSSVLTLYGIHSEHPYF